MNKSSPSNFVGFPNQPPIPLDAAQDSPTNNLKELNDIEKWLANSFESFLREDPTRLTSASPKMAANYVVARFENLLASERNLILDTILASEKMQDEDEAGSVYNGKVLNKNAFAIKRNKLRAELRAMLEGLKA